MLDGRKDGGDATSQMSVSAGGGREGEGEGRGDAFTPLTKPPHAETSRLTKITGCFSFHADL